MKFIDTKAGYDFLDKVMFQGKIETIVGYTPGGTIIITKVNGWSKSAGDVYHPSVTKKDQFWGVTENLITLVEKYKHNFDYEIY